MVTIFDATLRFILMKHDRRVVVLGCNGNNISGMEVAIDRLIDSVNKPRKGLRFCHWIRWFCLHASNMTSDSSLLLPWMLLQGGTAYRRLQSRCVRWSLLRIRGLLRSLSFCVVVRS
jgi:hypothetical protein